MQKKNKTDVSDVWVIHLHVAYMLRAYLHMTWFGVNNQKIIITILFVIIFAISLAAYCSNFARSA